MYASSLDEMTDRVATVAIDWRTSIVPAEDVQDR